MVERKWFDQAYPAWLEADRMALLVPAGGALPGPPAGALLHRLLVLLGELAVRAARRGADARVQPQARDDRVGVAAVRVHGDPLALAGLAPLHEAAGGHRGVQAEVGVAEQRVGHGARAVVALVLDLGVA